MLRLFLFSFIFFHTEACEEVKYQKVKPTTESISFPLSRSSQIMRIVIVNSTITCSNFTSLESIDYHFQETYYDQFLKIVNSSISTVPSIAFSKSPFLKKLFLSGNNIEKITPGAFNGLRLLEELYLDNNRMSVVPHLVLNSLYELRVLDLSNNKIERIEKFALMGLNKLEVLNLRHNKIVRVEDGVLKSLKSLQVLFVSHNPLVNVSIVGLKSLETLSLSNTSLSHLENWSNFTTTTLDLSFSNFTQVNFTHFPESDNVFLSKSEVVSIVGCESLRSKFLNLDHNRIENIAGVFVGLRALSLSGNKLRHLEGFLSKSPTLESVDLSNNKILTIHGRFLKNLTRLVELLLQHNNIAKIETTVFRDLTSLRVLNLSDNALESFAYGTFDSLSNLEILDLSRNNIHDLQQLHSLVNLQHLFLDNNDVSEFQTKFFPRLRTISLDVNPWSCQNLVTIEAQLRKKSGLMLPGASFDSENFHGVACKNEVEVESEFDKLLKILESRLVPEKVEKLTAVQEVELNYTSKIFVYVVVVQIVVMLLLLFVVFLIFKYVKNKKVEEPKRRRFPDFELF